jgi:hypothetical protein
MDIFNNNQLIQQFNKYYPDIKIHDLDPELLADMMLNSAFDINSKNIGKTNQKSPINPTNIINIPDNKKSDSDDEGSNFMVSELIQENFLLANELIPEMAMVPTELIYLKGKLNGLPINIILDSGAQSSVTFKSIVDKAGLDYLVDKKSTHYTIGVNDIKMNYGVIWYIDLELEISDNQYASIPITLDINDDTNLKTKEKELDIKKTSLKPIDMLLGINFLKAYKGIVNFNKRTITLNDSIIINYK